MTATTVFPTTGINRDIVRWEEHLDTLTPVENRAGTWQQDGIDFHPTYEGKMMSYMHEHATRFAHLTRHDNTALIWIVGSSPKAAR